MTAAVRENLETMLGELSTVCARLNEADVEKLVRAILEAKSLFAAGAGRSGFLLRCFVMRMMHMNRSAHLVGDATTPSATPGDLLLIGSGSGETGSLVMLAKKAGILGVKTALVTTNPSSTLAGMATVITVITAPHPKAAGRPEATVSAQPMGNLFEQSMFLLLEAVVMALMKRAGLTSEEMFTRHANLE